MKSAVLALIVSIGFFGSSASRPLAAQDPRCAARGDSLAVVKDEVVNAANATRPLAAGRWRSEVGCIEWASATSKRFADRFEASRKKSQIAYVLAWVPMLYLIGADVANKRPETPTVVAAGAAIISGVTIGTIFWGDARRRLNQAVKEHNVARQTSPGRF